MVFYLKHFMILEELETVLNDRKKRNEFADYCPSFHARSWSSTGPNIPLMKPFLDWKD